MFDFAPGGLRASSGFWGARERVGRWSEGLRSVRRESRAPFLRRLLSLKTLLSKASFKGIWRELLVLPSRVNSPGTAAFGDFYRGEGGIEADDAAWEGQKSLRLTPWGDAIAHELFRLSIYA